MVTRLILLACLFASVAHGQCITASESVNRNGLVGRWLVPGHISATKALDASGGGYQAAASNAPTFGVVNGLPAMTCSNQFYDAGAVLTGTITARTICVWLKSATGEQNKGVAGHWNGTSGIFMQSRVSPGDGILVLAGGGNDVGQFSLTTTRRFQHAALVYDGSLSGNTNRLQAFIDGARVPLTYNGPAAIPASVSVTQTLQLGRVQNVGRFWNGSLADLRIYNRALSAGELRRIAQGLE
jgi:hypothetical protein